LVTLIMEKNVGGYDRLARFVLGPLLIILGIAAVTGIVSLGTGTLGVALAAVALLLGVVFTATAAMQTCVLNSLLGVNTYDSSSGRRSSSDEAKPSAK